MTKNNDGKFKRQTIRFTPICAKWMEMKVDSGSYASHNDYINELIRNDFREAVETEKLRSWLKRDGDVRESLLDAFEGICGMPKEARDWFASAIVAAVDEINISELNSVGKLRKDL